MARDQAVSNIRNSRGKRPQGIKKQQVVRKSLRLQAVQQSHEQSSSKRNHAQGAWIPLSPPASNIREGRKVPQRPQTLHKPSTSSRKRKRGQEEEEEVERPSSQTQEQTPSKRLQTPPSSCTNRKESHQVPASDVSEGSADPLRHWIQTGKWQEEYFVQDSQVREDFERGKSPEIRGTWLQEHYAREPFRKMHAFDRTHDFLARKKSSASLRRKQSQSSIQTPSDEPSREKRSSQYNTPDYEVKLQQKGSYMRKSPLNITDASKELCRTLLEKEQTIPQNTLFRDDIFEETCERVKSRNEAMVLRDITPLICPSAQVASIFGAKHLDILYESLNEAWSSMNEYEGTLPQPDYSLGFGLSAFTKEQLSKLKPFVGDPGFKVITYFMATTRLYFPFLTCELKCGAAALDVADRQNAQSMSVALRALVVLFRFVKREKELDRKILTFSISHDHRSVRIYGHYPVIKEDNSTSFYRHPIHEFSFTAQDGKEKWTAYKFVKNVYDHHSPKLHKLICSAIDDLPANISFDLSQSASFSQSTPESLHHSNAESVLGEDDSQLLASQEVTPKTSSTQATEPASKKPRNQRTDGPRP